MIEQRSFDSGLRTGLRRTALIKQPVGDYCCRQGLAGVGAGIGPELRVELRERSGVRSGVRTGMRAGVGSGAQTLTVI